MVKDRLVVTGLGSIPDSAVMLFKDPSHKGPMLMKNDVKTTQIRKQLIHLCGIYYSYA